MSEIKVYMHDPTSDAAQARKTLRRFFRQLAAPTFLDFIAAGQAEAAEAKANLPCCPVIPSHAQQVEMMDRWIANHKQEKPK